MMEKAKRKIISEYRPQAYYQSVGKIVVLCLAVFPFVGFLFGLYELIFSMAQQPAKILFLPLSLIGSGIYGVLTWRIFYLCFVDKIIITPEGIVVEGWHSAFAMWNTLSHFEYEVTSGRAKKSVYGIHTIKPVTNPKSKVRFDYDFTENFIPLSHVVSFTYRMKWRELRRELALDEFAKTPLGQDLLHYAPQLFEGVDVSIEKRKHQYDAQ